MSALTDGQVVSHYRILRSLGAGGMGEVYLAEDSKLGRQVALKVLAHEMAADPGRRARFEREARAVAALNHPGIVTIHSVEEDQGLLFITMELVEGTTLSDRIPANGLSLQELLRLAIPLADAVGTAHHRGITHRDLKPANVMVGSDGRVKVLDFGLAKQLSGGALQEETALPPTANLTGHGKIIGTVPYMSPEQAQGRAVDQRSDIFSLGVVLFEMATGTKPFTGDSSVSVLSSVLRDTPPLVSELKPELPRELARIIKHCLVKDPEDRYQNAKDLRNDLRALKEESESGELAAGSAAGATAVSGISTPPTPVPSAVMPRPGRRGMWVGLAALAIVAAGSIAAWGTSAPQPPRVVSTKQITTDGAPKFTPITDGARIYFQVSQLGGGRQARSALGQVAASGGDTVQLTAAAPSILDIDPAGTELLVSSSVGTGDGVLEVMPVLGGVEHPVGEIHVNNPGMYGSSAVWTPDKSHIVYANGTELRIARSDGSGSRSLLTAPGIPFSPRISPDGQTLRYTVRDAKTGGLALWEAAADGTNPHALFPGWAGGKNPCCGTWTADGRYYVFEQDGDLWAHSETRGFFRRRTDDPVQLTFGPLRLSQVAPSRDGKRLFAIGDQSKGRLARYDPKSGGFVEYLGGLSAEGVVISPDGAWMVYSAYPEYTLWRSRLDGTERLQLTFGPAHAFLPRWSPDGSQIAFFAGTSTESFRVYLIPATGGTPRRATAGGTPEADPTWSPDGRQLAFGSSSGGQAGTRPDTAIQVLDVGTGRLTTLPGSQGLFSPRWSPDGRSIVAMSLDSTRLVVFDVASQKWSRLATGEFGWPSWSADSSWLMYLRGAPGNSSSEMARVRLADRRVETVATLAGVKLAYGGLGPWYGSTPDGWPIVLIDTGTHDVYALDWDAP